MFKTPTLLAPPLASRIEFVVGQGSLKIVRVRHPRSTMMVCLLDLFGSLKVPWVLGLGCLVASIILAGTYLSIV
jgi:hypothetical protein